MKRLKLFPKTFFYTLAFMLFVVIVHIFIYLLASQMQLELFAAQNTADRIIVSVNEKKL